VVLPIIHCPSPGDNPAPSFVVESNVNPPRLNVPDPENTTSGPTSETVTVNPIGVAADVGVGVGVSVLVGVVVGSGVTLLVGVFVGSGVGVSVGVIVGVVVGSGVGVSVFVGVTGGVPVGVAVLVGVGETTGRLLTSTVIVTPETNGVDAD